VTAPIFASSEDAGRRRALRRMRGVALSLLLFAAAVYLLTLHASGAWAYLHATAEAAMVGAIADWFAVTAIFRHPLGLPIPHTAIIPTRKASLARSLQDFFTDNFLSEAVVRTRVADAQISSRVGAWLSEPANSAWVVDEASTLVSTVLEKVKDADVAVLVETELLPRLAAEPLSEVVGRLLADVVGERAHHGLVDLAVTETHRWLSENEVAFARALSTRAPWWTPQWLDEQVIHRLHTEATAWLAEIRDDPRHRARHALDDLLTQLADDLQHDPDTIERAERLKQRVLSQPQVAVTATSLWNAVRRALLESLAAPDSAVKKRAVASLSAFGDRVVRDVALRARLDSYAADAAAFLVERYGTELATVITDTIDRWDGEEAAARIELFVGRDLQFIRVNGTIVGGLAGLLIYTISVLL
jgi:uncharacterized membrane-anchored protein YjiN (DUF445 family)